MDSEQAEVLFKKLIDRTGVIVVTEKYKDLYSFSHLTFQEFFTAKYLVTYGIDVFQAAEDASSKNLRSLTGWWREVILLYSGMIKDTSTIVQTLCNREQKDVLGRELQIAAQCLLKSIEAPKPEVEQELFNLLFSIRILETLEPKMNSFSVKSQQLPDKVCE